MKKMKLLMVIFFIIFLLGAEQKSDARYINCIPAPGGGCSCQDTNAPLPGGGYSWVHLPYCPTTSSSSSSSSGIDKDFIRNDRGWNYDEIYGEPGGLGASKEDEETYKESGWGGISDARLSRPRWQKLSKLPKPRLKRIWHELRKNKTCYCEDGKSYCATSGKDCPDICIKRFPAFDQFCPKSSAKTEIPEETATKEEGSQENKEETPADKWQALKSKGKVSCEDDGRAYVRIELDSISEEYAWKRAPQYDQFCPHKWDILNNEKYIWMLYPENFPHVLSMIKYDFNDIENSLKTLDATILSECKDKNIIIIKDDGSAHFTDPDSESSIYEQDKKLKEKLFKVRDEYAKIYEDIMNTVSKINALKELASTYGSQSQVDSLNKLKAQIDKIRSDYFKKYGDIAKYSSHF